MTEAAAPLWLDVHLSWSCFEDSLWLCVSRALGLCPCDPWELPCGPAGAPRMTISSEPMFGDPRRLSISFLQFTVPLRMVSSHRKHLEGPWGSELTWMWKGVSIFLEADGKLHPMSSGCNLRGLGVQDGPFPLGQGRHLQDVSVSQSSPTNAQHSTLNLARLNSAALHSKLCDLVFK